MALRTDSTSNTSNTSNTVRPTTVLGEALEQINDHRLCDYGMTEFRFCESSQDLILADSPRPEPEVIWAD